jgi:hypothetical protein
LADLLRGTSDAPYPQSRQFRRDIEAFFDKWGEWVTHPDPDHPNLWIYTFVLKGVEADSATGSEATTVVHVTKGSAEAQTDVVALEDAQDADSGDDSGEPADPRGAIAGPAWREWVTRSIRALDDLYGNLQRVETSYRPEPAGPDLSRMHDLLRDVRGFVRSATNFLGGAEYRMEELEAQVSGDVDAHVSENAEKTLDGAAPHDSPPAYERVESVGALPADERNAAPQGAGNRLRESGPEPGPSCDPEHEGPCAYPGTCACSCQPCRAMRKNPQIGPEPGPDLTALLQSQLDAVHACETMGSRFHNLLDQLLGTIVAQISRTEAKP